MRVARGESSGVYWETLVITNHKLLTPREFPVFVSISEDEILICGGFMKSDGFVLNTSSEPVMRKVVNKENFHFLSLSNQVMQTKLGQIVALVQEGNEVLHLVSYHHGDSSIIRLRNLGHKR